jgi:putative transcriptional regulator
MRKGREGIRLGAKHLCYPAPRTLKPAEIRRIHLALNASQALFARFLNVSANTVESWEQGLRQPDQAALKLLTIAKKHPQAVLSA